MIQQLNSHLNICRWTRNDNQALSLTTRRCRRTVDSYASSTGLHDLDLTSTHMSNLVDFTSTFANNAAHKIVGNINLLRLQLLRLLRLLLRRRPIVHIRVRVARNVGRRHPRWSTRIARWTIAGVCIRRHPFVGLDQDVPNVIRSDMNRIRNARNTEHSLETTQVCNSGQMLESRQTNLCRTGQHSFTCIQACSAGILNFLDLGTAFANY
jgi:hypothetical protein